MVVEGKRKDSGCLPLRINEQGTTHGFNVLGCIQQSMKPVIPLMSNATNALLAN